MKKIILVWALSFISISVFSQNNLIKSDDAGRISLTSVVPNQIEGLPPSINSNLINKLNQISTKYGMGGGSLNNRFILTTNVVVITKDITPTAPPMYAYTIEVTLYIGDGIEGLLFTSVSSTLKGVGETETKAYNSALKNLKIEEPKFKEFIERGKNKIIEYYNSKCDFILKEAEMLSGQNKFEAAIYKLVSIPEVCKECYDKAMNAVPPIFQKKIDRDCKMKLQEANGIWNAGQDISSAEKAAAILSTIEPTAACFPEVQNLNKRIADKVKQIDDREWKYTLKTQAQVSELIDAYKAIGVAYGNNQPQNISYNFIGWW